MKDNQNLKSKPVEHRNKPNLDSSEKGIVTTSKMPTKSTPASENCEHPKQSTKKGGL